MPIFSSDRPTQSCTDPRSGAEPCAALWEGRARSRRKVLRLYRHPTAEARSPPARSARFPHPVQVSQRGVRAAAVKACLVIYNDSISSSAMDPTIVGWYHPKNGYFRDMARAAGPAGRGRVSTLPWMRFLRYETSGNAWLLFQHPFVDVLLVDVCAARRRLCCSLRSSSRRRQVVAQHLSHLLQLIFYRPLAEVLPWP